MLQVSQIPPVQAAATEAESRALAYEDMAAIFTLRKTAAFEGYFMRRLREKCDALTIDILENDSLENREQARAVRKALLEICSMIDRDETACRSLI